MEDFVYDLTTIRYNPNTTGLGNGNGYQPYAKWVANEIEDKIKVFGEDNMNTFNTSTDFELQTLYDVLSSNQTGLSAELANLKSELN